jgi:hypothetical protein
MYTGEEGRDSHQYVVNALIERLNASTRPFVLIGCPLALLFPELTERVALTKMWRVIDLHRYANRRKPIGRGNYDLKHMIEAWRDDFSNLKTPMVLVGMPVDIFSYSKFFDVVIVPALNKEALMANPEVRTKFTAEEITAFCRYSELVTKLNTNKEVVSVKFNADFTSMNFLRTSVSDLLKVRFKGSGNKRNAIQDLLRVKVDIRVAEGEMIDLEHDDEFSEDLELGNIAQNDIGGLPHLPKR